MSDFKGDEKEFQEGKGEVSQSNPRGLYKLPTGSFVDYDGMTDDEYFAEMERKVEYYKQNFPDMYTKAEKWLEMMNDSQIYQANAPNDENVSQPDRDKANDIMKNAMFNGWIPDDLLDSQQQLLTKWIPDWKQQLLDNNA